MIKQKQRDELMGYLLDPSRQERNILKMCEEMAELQEVLLKYVNKTLENRPPLAKIIEELGDVGFRGQILIEQFNIYNEVEKRMHEKEEQVHNWYLNKQLKGQENV